jgi:hypothetical protein
MTNFATWWHEVGSGMRPDPNEDTEEFAHRIASSAWHNCADAAFTACEAACDQIETDKWALYKGRAPYTGQEAGRAEEFTQGQADGAALCLEAIKARRSA